MGRYHGLVISCLMAGSGTGAGHCPTTCSHCSKHFNILSGQTCWNKVTHEAGEYIDENGRCKFCDASCAKCIGPGKNNCIGCSPTRIFDNKQCVLRCPSDKYELNRQCHQCHHTCHECNGSEPDTCTSCGKDKNGIMRFLYNGECREGCPQGHYAAESTCIQCPLNCDLCNSPTECIRCLEGFYLDNGDCKKQECPEGQTEDPDTGNCVSCTTGCNKCYTYDPSSCITCIKGFYMYEEYCYDACPENTYRNDSLMSCIDCALTCFSCTEDQCIECEEGFYLLDGECVTDCGSGFYMDDINKECDSCYRTCDSCTGPVYDECTSCKTTYTLQKGRCIPKTKIPEEGTFMNREGKPEPCDRTCKTCNGSASACTSCKPGTYLQDQSCIEECPYGLFENEKDGRCEKCTVGCESCTEANVCLKCSDGYLHEGKCYTQCPRGFFGNTGACEKCSPDCETCRDNADYCLSCHSPKLLEQARCTSACSDRYMPIEGVCKHCSPGCKTCLSLDHCTECMRGYFLFDDKCMEHCPDGYYEENGNCNQCDPMCAKCSGPDPDDCEECSSKSFFLYNGECFGTCPEGTYYEPSTKDCQDCDTSCKTCSSSTICDSCKDNLVKNREGFCVTHKDCSLYQYQDEHKNCHQCHKKCSRCMGATEHHCLSCPSNQFLLNSTCVAKCPDGYYSEEEEHRCAPCHSTCLACFGKRSTHCLSCKIGWYSLGGACVQHCITGYYAENSTNKCEKCHVSCEECSGPEASNCLSCHKNFFLMRAKQHCVSSCPESYYEDHTVRRCERCHPTCKTCTSFGALACTSCVWSYRLSGHICNSECLTGEYKKDPDQPCEKCHDNCVECKGPGPLNCTVCPASQVLYVDEGRCVHCCHGNPVNLAECCDCSATLDECILVKGLITEPEGKQKTALFITTSMLLLLSIGAILFYWRRSKAKSVSKAGYEKLPEQTKSFQSFKSRESTSSFQRGQVIEYHDREEEEGEDDDDDDDDIVYMGQDGTVYRKFKYGLLEDEEEDDLEYDDESYSFR